MSCWILYFVVDVSPFKALVKYQDNATKANDYSRVYMHIRKLMLHVQNVYYIVTVWYSTPAYYVLAIKYTQNFGKYYAM